MNQFSEKQKSAFSKFLRSLANFPIYFVSKEKNGCRKKMQVLQKPASTFQFFFLQRLNLYGLECQTNILV